MTLTRGLLPVVVVDGIKRRYFTALKRTTENRTLTGSQTVTLLQDLDRLLGAYEEIAYRLRQLDLVLDDRAHTKRGH